MIMAFIHNWNEVNRFTNLLWFFPINSVFMEMILFHIGSNVPPLFSMWDPICRIFGFSLSTYWVTWGDKTVALQKKMWIGGSMTEAGYGDKMDIVRIMIEWDITQHQSLGWKRGYALNITEMIFFDILWPIMLCSSWASPLEWDSTWFHGWKSLVLTLYSPCFLWISWLVWNPVSWRGQWFHWKSRVFQFPSDYSQAPPKRFSPYLHTIQWICFPAYILFVTFLIDCHVYLL